MIGVLDLVGVTASGWLTDRTVVALGRNRAGVVFGWTFAAHRLGASAAAWAGGVVRVGGHLVPTFPGAGRLGVAAAAMARDGRRGPGSAARRPVA